MLPTPAHRHGSRIVRRAQWAGVFLLGCASLAVAADKVAELSDEFLEYLGSLEGDDESWLDFASTAAPRDPPAKPVSAQAAASSSSAASRSSSAMSDKVDK